MTARARTGKKRYVVERSTGWPGYEVVDGKRCGFATFHGRNSYKYAKRHAKMLNGLKREEQP